ncbi:MAG: GNAT family N-acetyltransferase [Armatimonadetes bacterium]|nr:GNAT family N-acetyltransferase [Armatimonadota bacterium]MDW8029147.1 GNAT family N-acetyltransferase [Armatimonadota bacterium]
MAGTEIRIEREMRGKVHYFWVNYEGKDVSRLLLFDLNVRFGEAVVRMGGIGGVETDEAYRMRGFARRLLDATNKYMKEAGFDIGGLFGIPNFYERWGYITVLPEYRLFLPTENLKVAKLRHSVVNYDNTLHKSEVLKIYEANNRRRICSVVRKPEDWSGFPRGTEWFVKVNVKVFLNETGGVEGYLSIDDVSERTAVAEVGFATPKVFESMAAFLAQRASEFGHNEITLLVPPDHEFAIYLRQFGCTATEEFFRSGEGMMRVINLESLMQKLSVELTKRLKNSPIRDHSCTFAIVTDIGSVKVEVCNSQVLISPCEPQEADDKLELPQSKLMQLLTGYQTIAILLVDDDVHCSPSLVPILDVLFPPAYPYIWWADRI